jgi:predicted PurR-regulated permease PerM
MLLLNNKIEKIKVEFAFLPSEFIPNIETIELKITEFFINIIGKVFNMFTHFISYIISLLMSIILMIYFLLDFDKICLFIKEQAKKVTKIDLLEYFRNIKETIYAYFKGVILVSTIVFVLSFISFRIININYALMMGLIIGITDIIPYIGPYIGGSIVAVIASSDSIEKMIMVIIVVIIIQGLESWFITPKIQSKKISVHPILVLLFIVIFGKIMGVIGMLIAVPVLAILQTTLKTKLNK